MIDKNFDFWEDGVGLGELIIVYTTMCLIVLKVFNMITWPWSKVLMPSVGFLILIGMELTRWAILYGQGKYYKDEDNGFFKE